MTTPEFKAWFRGYIEGRDGNTTDEELRATIARIEEEVANIDDAVALMPLIDLERILRETPKVEPFPGMPNPWRIEPYKVTYIPNDCGCDPNSVCGNSACPRAIRYNDVFGYTVLGVN